MILRNSRLTASLFRRIGTRNFQTSRCWAAPSKRTLKPFLLADIGEGITECEIVKWSVKPSSQVEAFDALCEVQSDKASVEITSPFDGVVKTLFVKEGEIAKVGEALCTIEVEEEDDGSHEEVKSIPTKQPPPSKQGTSTGSPKGTVLEASAKDEGRKKHPLDPTNTNKGVSSDAHVLATPAVRHFARQSGISDLSVLAPGSGRAGRLERTDVEAYLLGSQRESSQSTVSAVHPEIMSPTDQTIELGRTRHAMWKAMTKSLDIPHFGYSSLLDLTALSAFLPSLNHHIPPRFNPPPPPKYPAAISPLSIYGSSPPPEVVADEAMHFTKMTMLPLLLKALSGAMQEWPIFRGSINAVSDAATRPSLTVRPQSDIAIAVSTPTGLYTPVLQAVENKSPYQIMAELRRLQALGRRVPSGFSPAEMPKRGATVTVSNVGAIGKGEFAAPLLVPGGGVAIVAIGRAKWVERDGDRRLEVGVSWSADHRVVEGAEMAAFVECWRSWVEHPARLIGEGK